jgi:hypothetical protein
MADDGTRDANSRPTVPNTNGTGRPDADADQRVRTIQDDTGRTWTVSEKQLVTDSQATPSLLCVTDYSIRRVREYPANWFKLSDPELFAVSLNR